jgi:hypothetical protein
LHSHVPHLMISLSVVLWVEAKPNHSVGQQTAVASAARSNARFVSSARTRATIFAWAPMRGGRARRVCDRPMNAAHRLLRYGSLAIWDNP